MRQVTLLNSNAIPCQIQVRHSWIGPLSKKVRRPRWILLVASQSVLDEGVLALLDRKPELNVAIATFVDDARFLDEVAAIRPSVILLNEAGPLRLFDILNLIRQSPALAWTRVITYGMETKAVEVYDYRRVVVVESKHFLELLHA